MAQAQLPNQFIDPYADYLKRQYERQQQMASQPIAPAISPEELQSRQAENQRLQMMGHLGILSGDKPLSTIGSSVLEQAIKAQQKKQTDHGEYDPLSGEFKYFPQYQRQRQEEQLSKDIERAERGSAEARKDWQAQQQRSQDQLILRQTMSALRPPADPGSLTYAGTHPETGEPVLLHSKAGPIYRGQPYKGVISNKPQGATSTEREDLATLQSNIQGLDQAVMQVEAVKKKGGGTFSGIIPGTVADLHPALQATVTSFKSDQEKNAASQIAYVADGIRAGRFGLTLTLAEKASSVQYLPSPYDDLDELSRKGKALNELLRRDQANRLATMDRPGAPAPRLPGATGLGGPAPGLPGGTPGAPLTGGGSSLPPGWTITPVK
jgi:hypothetical protein